MSVTRTEEASVNFPEFDHAWLFRGECGGAVELIKRGYPCRERTQAAARARGRGAVGPGVVGSGGGVWGGRAAGRGGRGTMRVRGGSSTGAVRERCGALPARGWAGGVVRARGRCSGTARGVGVWRGRGLLGRYGCVEPVVEPVAVGGGACCGAADGEDGEQNGSAGRREPEGAVRGRWAAGVRGRGSGKGAVGGGMARGRAVAGGGCQGAGGGVRHKGVAAGRAGTGPAAPARGLRA